MKVSEALHYMLDVKKNSQVRATREQLTERLGQFIRLLNDPEIEAVTTDDINRFTDWLFAKQNSPNTVFKKRKQVSSLFLFCEEQGIIRWSPFRERGLRYIQQEPPKRIIFTEQQYRKLLSFTLRQEAFWWNYACRIAWNTGMRIGDVACLEWAMIDWEQEIIRLVPNKTRRTKAAIEIPIEPELMELFVEMKASRRFGCNAYVLGEMRQHYITTLRHSYLSTWFTDMTKKLFGIAIGFHSFRHTFITRLRTANVPADIIGSITGQSVEMVMQYGVVTTDAKRNALRLVRDQLHEQKLKSMGFEMPTYNPMLVNGGGRLPPANG